jgi:lipid kinase YegS
VVAAGGDGTINEVLHGVVQAGLPVRPALGVVPMGTANDFAAGVGLPLGDPVAALKLIAETEAVPIDLARMGDRYFLNVASGGFGSEVTAATPEGMKKLLGSVAYLLTGLVSWGSIQARSVRLAGPRLAWEGNLYVLAVGNGRQAGGGFRLCDRARVDDGLLDVLVVPEVPLEQVTGLLGELMAGHTPADAEHLLYHQVPWLEVEAPDGMQFNLDGEPLQGTAFRFEVLPGQVRFFLPPCTGAEDHPGQDI